MIMFRHIYLNKIEVISNKSGDHPPLSQSVLRINFKYKIKFYI